MYLLKAFFGRLPVDDVPDRLEVFRFAVLVVKAITSQHPNILPVSMTY